jgi:hypothetical protein
MPLGKIILGFKQCFAYQTRLCSWPLGTIIPGFKNAFCIRAFVDSDKAGLCLLCLVFQSAILLPQAVDGCKNF